MKTLLSILFLALAAFGQQPPVRSVVCNDAGANDTYTCTASPTLTAYTTGMRVQFKPNTANTGAATLNIDSVGAAAITKLSGAINTALADNDLRAGQYTLLIYDGTQFQMLSQLGNVASGGNGLGFVYSSGPSAGTAGSITNTGPPMGQVSTMQSAANWFRVAARVPAACTAKNLYVRLGVAQAGGASLVVTLYTGATTPTATTLTCTIASGSQDCSDVANTASIAAGDLIYLAYANASATAFTYANTSFQCN